MPPDLRSFRPLGDPRPELFDRTIPRGNTVKTRTSGVFAVNMQVGPLIATPVAAAVLWHGTEAMQTGLVVVGLLLGAARRSQLVYRRVRME
ncbi:hypothetical protein ACF065_34615 [Streptomyces sp. NPDC015232]|uniref:hypothetical protein n=1 Tax=unclassified Streptomyces TaxID=2593676 RepID=UPI0036FE5327